MRRLRLDPAVAGMLRALARREGASPELVEARSTPWSSISFTGARHRLALRCRDAGSAAALAGLLPELDLPIRGHLVADVGSVEQDGDVIRFEALTVVDG